MGAWLHLAPPPRRQALKNQIFFCFSVELSTTLIAVNSLVHVIMYTYYFLSNLGPSVRKYLWWKRHVTKLQIVSISVDIWFCRLRKNNVSKWPRRDLEKPFLRFPDYVRAVQGVEYFWPNSISEVWDDCITFFYFSRSYQKLIHSVYFVLFTVTVPTCANLAGSTADGRLQTGFTLCSDVGLHRCHSFISILRLL